MMRTLSSGLLNSAIRGWLICVRFYHHSNDFGKETVKKW